eukprot:1124338-Pelagomonas_calceolata.AAC.15
MAGRPARQRTVPLCCCMLSAHTGGDGCAASASGVVAAPAAAASCIPSWDPGGCACHCCFAPCCPAAGAASSPPTCLRPTLGPSAVACALTQLPLRSKLQLWCGPRSVMAVLDPPDVWVPRRPAEEPSWMVVAAGAVILVVVAMVLTRCAASCWCTWCHVDKKSWKLGSSRAGVSLMGACKRIVYSVGYLDLPHGPLGLCMRKLRREALEARLGKHDVCQHDQTRASPEHKAWAPVSPRTLSLSAGQASQD